MDGMNACLCGVLPEFPGLLSGVCVTQGTKVGLKKTRSPWATRRQNCSACSPGLPSRIIRLVWTYYALWFIFSLFFVYIFV